MIQTISTKDKNAMAAWGKKALASGVLIAALVTGLAVAPPAHASTTFTVNIAADEHDLNTNDGLCDAIEGVGFPGSQCTLRAAIEQANATPGADTIDFDISGSGVHTINPGSISATANIALPAITETVTIDGYTQPGSSPNTLAKGTNAKPMIGLGGLGTATGDTNFGLIIKAQNSVVRGLVIGHFHSIGVEVLSGGDGSRIEGNFVGTDPSGTQDLANHDNAGVVIDGASNVTVGGTTPAARNLISGNDADGVSISNSTGNQVLGNLIGTKKDGTGALGNSFNGVRITNASSKNTVGNGSSAGANTIAFNGFDGVQIKQDSSQPNSANGNRVLRNSIFSNGALGIELFPALGVNPNDPGDADSGANEGQNFPVLSSAKTSSTKTTLTGKLNSTPGTSFKVQFFSNPSGTDEGKKFIGQKKVSTNTEGKVSFTFSPAQKVGVGKTVTATVTGPGGNTSEFSAPKKVVAL